MNIFNKVTLQNMKKSRTRTIVTVIGVILSATMITAVATFGTSLLNFLVNGSIVKYGGWHIEFLDVNSSFVQQQTDDKKVTGTITFSNIGYAILDSVKTPEKPYLFIAGFNDETFNKLPISIISGRLPENSDEVLVPAHIAIKGGIRFTVGDTLSLDIGNRMDGDRILGQHIPYQSGDEPEKNRETFVPKTEKVYKVVGTYERPTFEEHSAPGYTLITKEDILEQVDSFNLFVTLKNPRQIDSYIDSTVETESYILNDYVLRFMGISDDKLFNTLLYTVGSILVAIIMVSSIFLIYNSFNISMNERIHQFGILSSIGATSKQLRNSVLFEGICIGIIGIPIGIVVGIISIKLVIPIVAKNFGNIFPTDVALTLSVSFPVIVVAALVSLITILISAYIPAKKAVNTPIMECIRQTNEIKTEAKVVKISKFSRRIYGLEGTLALKNFKRNKKRYRSIVLSLTLSIVLFISGNVFGTTLKRISELYVVDIDYDILFTAENIDDSERLLLYNKLKSVDGVYESMSQTVFEYSCAINTNDLSELYQEYSGYTTKDEIVQLPMYLQFIEDSEYLRFIEEKGLPTEEYVGQHSKMIAVAKQQVNNQDGSVEVLNVFANDSVICNVSPKTEDESTIEQDITMTLVDTYSVDPIIQVDKQNPLAFIMILPYSLKENFETTNIHSYIGFSFFSNDPLQSVGEMETIIQKTGITSNYALYSVHSMVDQFRSLTFVVDVFTYFFVIMISLIAIANVFNTISTNIKLRKRELAMLRSIGMSDRSFNKMMNFECVFYGMKALIFGLPIAGIISWLIYKGLVSVERIDDFHFVLPWSSMTVSVVSVFFIVFITMLYSSSKIKKENIIDALRDDMT